MVKNLPCSAGDLGSMPGQGTETPHGSEQPSLCTTSTESIFWKILSSVAQSCPTLCDPMNRSTPGLPVHHQLPEFTQTHVHRVSDAIQPSHPLSSPSPLAPNPSQHQSLFQWVNSSHEVAKILQDCNKDSLMLQLRILEWVAMSFSGGSSQPRNWTLISRIAGRFFTVWATKKALRHNAAKLINFFRSVMMEGLKSNGNILYCKCSGVCHRFQAQESSGATGRSYKVKIHQALASFHLTLHF